MRLQLGNVARRADSSVFQFRQRVPTDLLAKAKGQTVFIPFPAFRADPEVTVAAIVGPAEIKFSLLTRDPKVAKARTALAQERIARVWDGLRQGPQPISHRLSWEIAGDVYRHMVAANEENPGLPEDWAALKGISRAVMEGRLVVPQRLKPIPGIAREVELARVLLGHDMTAGINALPSGPPSIEALDDRFGLLVAWALGNRGLNIDAPSRSRLLMHVAEAVQDAGWQLKRNASGDYRPDPQAARYPLPRPVSTGPRLTLADLLDGWWNEAKRTGSATEVTRQNYAGVFKSVTAFLKDKATNDITDEDVIRYKDFRLASVNPRTGRTISAKTIKDTDLVALKSVFGWAVTNKKLLKNPAAGVTLKIGKKKEKTRESSFTDAEARAVLTGAGSATQGTENDKEFFALRWTPWIQCYTGCRISEAAQLRKEDVAIIDGHWTIRFTPEAGGIKDKEYRIAVMHPHLVELGFPAFVHSRPSGHLFITPSRNGVKGPLHGVVNRVTGRIGEFRTDKAVQPTHAWRHRFKTIARTVGIDRVITHAICGHDERDVGDKYGHVTFEAQARALALFPRQGG